jgi:hypothetical protein
MYTERELTIDELDAVSGGLVVIETKSFYLEGKNTTGGGAGPAISAWNNALVSSGFPPMA